MPPMHIDPHARAEGSLEAYTRGGSEAYTRTQALRSHVRTRTLAEPEQSVGTGACNNRVEQCRAKLV